MTRSSVDSDSPDDGSDALTSKHTRWADRPSLLLLLAAISTFFLSEFLGPQSPGDSIGWVRFEALMRCAEMFFAADIPMTCVAITLARRWWSWRLLVLAVSGGMTVLFQFK